MRSSVALMLARQIRAPKLLCLGKQEDASADVLCRPYWVLADNVGVSCKLVKGSRFIGADNVVVNIIKLDTRRCVFMFCK
ncbi:Non-specific serine/threonine protein kinase protein [Dioscorea alata]|uniref:Non-specific serine/threonine protein kinase protein n=1 Tax=Dioscorea alata TaxID=55571 RepID=A0ACB7UZ06_DIOAL|nr:Non-specific serine/threonine protein kinase protein [Dioscorea alata]